MHPAPITLTEYPLAGTDDRIRKTLVGSTVVEWRITPDGQHSRWSEYPVADAAALIAQYA